MEQVHILFLIDVLYSTHGGAEGVLWNITRLLPPERYRCSVATLATHAERVVADRFPCPVHRFPIRRTYDWNALRTACRLGRLIRSERVSIVHTFFPASDLFGAIVAKLSGCPILISSRRDMGFQRSILHRAGYRLLGGLYDQVHAVADGVRLHHIRQDRLDPRKVVTVYNGVDLSEIRRGQTGGGLNVPELESASPLVVCVANIRPVKALETLVETAGIVCRELPGARFLVVGAVQNIPYMQRVKELVSGLHLESNVVFSGPSSDVPAILERCDVFYLPSWSEGLSNAMLEAMACARPCVATEVGGNPELVANGRNGYLVPPGDAVAAARRILTLLRDPVRAREMGQVGSRIVASTFTVQAMIARLTELYEGLLRRSGATTLGQNRGQSEANELAPAAD